MNKYILTAACGLAFSAASAQTKALPDSPNILLILVDMVICPVKEPPRTFKLHISINY